MLPTQVKFIGILALASFLLATYFFSNGLGLPWNHQGSRWSLFLVGVPTSILGAEHMPLPNSL